MSLVPRSRLFDLDSFFSPSNMGAMWPSTETKDMTTFAPRVDISEHEGKYEIAAELPGVKKEDIHVNLENGILSLQAETKQESTEEENGKVIRQERRYGTFYRSFDLGSQVQESDIHAEFKDGVLKVIAPKVGEETSQSKRIDVR
ncbi:MAG: Hsp20/alpha crystallin family protein [Agarilytica sp.]